MQDFSAVTPSAPLVVWFSSLEFRVFWLTLGSQGLTYEPILAVLGRSARDLTPASRGWAVEPILSTFERSQTLNFILYIL